MSGIIFTGYAQSLKIEKTNTVSIRGARNPMGPNGDNQNQLRSSMPEEGYP